MGSAGIPSASFSAEKRVVKRTEQIWLKPNQTLRYFCHLSKNLYNEANYRIRQTLRKQNYWLRYYELCSCFKTSPNYQGLPAQTAQQTLKLLDCSWKAFFESIKEWKKYPEKFKKKPNPPGYKPKNGEYVLIFTNQQVSRKGKYLKFPKKIGLTVKTRLPKRTNLRAARVIPKNRAYVLEIIYTQKITPKEMDRRRVAGIDLGVTNLVTLVNNFEEPPIIIGGGIAKSLNQYYNKEKAQLQQIYASHGIKTGRKLQNLAVKRSRKLHNHFHKVSRLIVEWCVEHNAGSLVIGYNVGWKEGVKMGKTAKQNFIQIPFFKLVQQIQYKAEEQGIHVFLQEENHTSKCSFLDHEPIEHQEKYQGRRKSRGLFESANGRIINADVNGAYNIIKKAIPNAFTVDGIEGVGLHPERCQRIFRSELIPPGR